MDSEINKMRQQKLTTVMLRPRLINPQLFKEAKRILGLSAADVRRAAKEADRKIRSKHSPGIDRPV
jgi:hypothetical protein